MKTANLTKVIIDKSSRNYSIYEDRWAKVKCNTSSEKGERGGLTELQLWVV